MQFARNDIQRQHPDYTDFSAEWEFFNVSYIGGREWMRPSNLFRHPREAREDYEARLKRMVYTNYCEPVVDIYTSHIFGVETRPDRIGDGDAFAAFIEDVDTCGSTMDDYMREVSIDAQTFGFVGVVVDLPQSPIPIRTQADVIDIGIRPYVQTYTPLSITNWSVDRFGKLNWVRLKETVRLDADPFGEIKDGIVRYRTLTRDEWFVHDEHAEIVVTDGEPQAGVHGLGVVPFVPVYFKRHRTRNFIGLSQLADIARINRLLVNMISYIDQFVSKQAFPFLAAPVDAAMPDDGEDVAISEKHIYEYPAGSNPPAYVSPPTDTAIFMKDFITDFLRREIFRMAKLEQREMAEQSGVAKMMDFHQTNNALSRFARNLERAEADIYDIWARWLGVTPDIIVDYPDRFDIQPINEELENALVVRDLYGDRSPTFVSEHLKRLAARLEPKLADDVQAVIDGELDENAALSNQQNAFDAAIREAA